MTDCKEFAVHEVASAAGDRDTAAAALDQEEATVQLIIQCVELIFFKRGKGDVSATRAAAFIKRLLLLCTSLASPASVLALMECVRLLILRAPAKCHQLLDTDENRVGDAGAYLPEVEDPELCHPFAAGVWEWAVLAHHWHPSVRQWVRDSCRGTFQQLLEGHTASSLAALSAVRATAPKEMLFQYTTASGCAFNPSLTTLQRACKKAASKPSTGDAEMACRRQVPLQINDPCLVMEEAVVDADHIQVTLAAFRTQQLLKSKRIKALRLRRQTALVRRYFKD
jgi:hypothetical protein